MRHSSLFLVLCLAFAALCACGSRIPVTDRPDAQQEADAAMPAVDRTTPPPTDVVVTMPDGGSPSDVVVSPSDVPVTPEDRVAPPVDVVADASTPTEERPGMQAFNVAAAARFRERRVRVRDSEVQAEFVTLYPTLADGRVRIRISADMAGAWDCGYTTAICSGNVCDFPEPGTPDGCQWRDLTGEMENFPARSATGHQCMFDLLP